MFDRILETRIAQTLLWEFLPEVILIAVLLWWVWFRWGCLLVDSWQIRVIVRL